MARCDETLDLVDRYCNASISNFEMDSPSFRVKVRATGVALGLGLGIVYTLPAIFTRFVCH